jgi:hypothetical protein
MKKFGIFLEFEKKENNLINKIKSSVLLKIVGKHYYFLEKPHLTIYTFATNASISVISGIFRKSFHKLNFKKISYLRFKTFKNDLFTGSDTFVLLIKKEIKLLKLQKKIRDNFCDYFCFETKNINLFKRNKKILLNYKKYYFPYYGMIWLPHITIGSFSYTKNKNDIRNLYDLNIPKNLKISSITLNLISKFKTKKILTCR